MFLMGAHITFALMDATGKALSRDIAVPLVVLARNGFTLLFMALALLPVMGWALVRIKHLKLQLWRGLALFGFTMFFFTALKFLPQAEATAINFITPFFVMLLAGPLLGEKVGWWRWVATAAGFAGMLLVIRPGANLAVIGVVCALLTMLCNIAFQLLNRKAAQLENPLASVFWSSMVGFTGALCALPLIGQIDALGKIPNALTPMQWALMVSFGLSGSVSQYCLIRAYFYSSASFVATLVYLQIIWAVAAGWGFFGQLPDSITFLGISIITLSGIAVAVFEMLRNKR